MVREPNNRMFFQMWQAITQGRGATSTTVGMTAPLLGALISLVQSVEVWFRCASVVVGFAIGCVVLYSKIRNLNKKDKDGDTE